MRKKRPKRGSIELDVIGTAVQLTECRLAIMAHCDALHEVITHLLAGRHLAARARLEGAVHELGRHVEKDFRNTKIQVRARELKRKGKDRP